MADYLSVIVVGSDNAAKCMVANALCQRRYRFKHFHCKKLYDVNVEQFTIQGNYPRVVSTPCLSTPLWRTAYSKLYSDERYKHKCFLYVKDMSAIRLHDSEVLQWLQKSGDPVVVVITYKMGEKRFAELEQSKFLSDNWKTFIFDCNDPEMESKRQFSQNVFRTVGEMIKSEFVVLTSGSPQGDAVPGSYGARKNPIKGKGLDRVEPLKLDSVTKQLNKEQMPARRPGTPLPDDIVVNEEHWTKYSRALLEGYAESFSTRVNVVGYQDAGKTTLIKRLKMIDVDVAKDTARPTECLEIDQTTSRCTETDSGLQWETNKEGYDRNLNFQRMAAAIKALDCPAEDTYRPQITNRRSARSAINIREFTDLDLGSEEVDDGGRVTVFQSWDLFHRHRVKREYLKMVINKLERSPHMRRYISYWDFAGQSTYYTTHQAFLAPDAVYLLVVDLSKSTDNQLQDSLAFRTKNFQTTTVLDAIRFWAGSIKSFASDKENHLAPTIVVGTHADKVKQKRIESIFEEVKKTLGQSDLPCVAIDNTLPVHNDTRLNELRDRILDKALGVKEKIVNARWVELEFLLILEKEDRREAIIEMGRFLHLNDELENPLHKDELLEFLEYEHRNGFLMYFNSKGVDEIIILQPTVLVEFINLLLRQKKNSAIKGWNRDGTFDSVFIENAVSENYILTEHRETLLLLLQQLNIVYPKNAHKEDITYIMPCLFGDRPEKTDTFGQDCQKSPLLRISFEGKLIPPGFFHSLVVSLLTHGLELDSNTDSNGREVLHLYYHYSRFRLSKTGGTLLEMYWTESVIMLQFIHLSKRTRFEEAGCKRHLDFIENMVQTILDGYRHQCINYKLEVQCPSKDHESFVSFSDLQRHGELKCDGGQSSNVHMICASEVFSNWIVIQDVEKRTTEKTVLKDQGHVSERRVPSETIGRRQPEPSTSYTNNPTKTSLSQRLTQLHFVRLSTKLGSGYFLLFVSLGLGYSLIYQVKENHKNSTQEIIFHLLVEWSKRFDATVGNLLRGLEEAKLKLSDDDWEYIFCVK